ncbi:hypothetical protein C8J55DRAFT_487932 [Lentinula edodes]|uniref:RRM domain-containing protein n=1 Tax=Lentinula lateritia TaxID=40482 RepID=A0A9W9AMV1_9AGAR|nr:hypothetical protein C8J55DRAFT_487932 [Lentinula edodes]
MNSAKLTKKQKKGIAFRSGKGKGARKNDVGTSSNDTEYNSVPVLEIQDGLDIDDVEMENETVFPEEKIKDATASVREKGKGKAIEEKADAVMVPPNKRKRGSEPVMEKVKDGEGKEENVPKKKKKGNDEKQRFILFVGNLKYTTPIDSVKEHFSVCDPPPFVRLLTPKTSTPNNKSKGCAFLEFTHRNALQQALKLHQSKLDGRAINVELTSGGGGKSEARLQKLKERNKKLHEQRTERQGMNEENSAQPERYSATSGIGATPGAKKTWTVDDVEQGTVHRGGKKHNKKRDRSQRSNEWGTGVNAIPVG